jgi:hypothetical protein
MGITSSSHSGIQQTQEQHVNRAKFQQQPDRLNFGRSSSMGNDRRQEQQRFGNRQVNSNFGHHSQGGGGNQQSSQQPMARNPFQSQQEQQQQQRQQLQQQDAYNFSGQGANMGFPTGHQTSNMSMSVNVNMNMNSSNGGGPQQSNQFGGYDSSRINSQPLSQFQSPSPGFGGRFQSPPAAGWKSPGKANPFQQQGQGHGQSQPQFHQLSSDSLRDVDASAAIAGAITAAFSLGLPVSSSSTYPGAGGASATSSAGATQGSGVVADNAVSSSASASESVVNSKSNSSSVFSFLSDVPPSYSPYEGHEPFRAGFIPHIPPPGPGPGHAAPFNPSPFSTGLGYGVGTGVGVGVSTR